MNVPASTNPSTNSACASQSCCSRTEPLRQFGPALTLTTTRLIVLLVASVGAVIRTAIERLSPFRSPRACRHAGTTSIRPLVNGRETDDMVASDRRKWLALALLSGVQFMVVLDIAIVNVALPSIQVDLGFSEENLQWVISAYALVFGGFLLLGGRAADLLGRRRVFLVGLVVFTIASFLAGVAWAEA